jgi:predicted enzyme related to lactoylglutathione lyase
MSEPAQQPREGGRDHGAESRLASPGAITYLHIPAVDVRQAATFYREVFGWHVNNPDSDTPSFDTPGGQLSGAWVSAHVAASRAGAAAVHLRRSRRGDDRANPR